MSLFQLLHFCGRVVILTTLAGFSVGSDVARAAKPKVFAPFKSSKKLKPYRTNYLGDIRRTPAFFESLPGLFIFIQGEPSFQNELEKAIQNGSSLGNIYKSLGYTFDGFSIVGPPWFDDEESEISKHAPRILGIGDYNGDGIADLVVRDEYNFRAGRHEGGTTVAVAIITRLKPGEPFRIIQGEYKTLRADLSCSGDYFERLRSDLRRNHDDEPSMRAAFTRLRKERERCREHLATFQSTPATIDLLRAAYKLKTEDVSDLIDGLKEIEVSYVPDAVVEQAHRLKNLSLAYSRKQLPARCEQSYLNDARRRDNEEYCTDYANWALPIESKKAWPWSKEEDRKRIIDVGRHVYGIAEAQPFEKSVTISRLYSSFLALSRANLQFNSRFDDFDLYRAGSWDAWKQYKERPERDKEEQNFKEALTIYEASFAEQFKALLDNLLIRFDRFKTHETLQLLDANLNKTYQEAIERASHAFSGAAAMERELRNSERAWVKYRDAFISVAISQHGDSIAHESIREVVAAFLTNERIFYLKNFLTVTSESHGAL